MRRILPVRAGGRQGERRAGRSIALLVASIFIASSIVVPGPALAARPPASSPDSPTAAVPSGAGTIDWIGGIAEAITALTIVFVIVQLKDARRTARIERTRGFQERYQSDTFDAASRRMLGCVTVVDTDDCIAVIKACSNRRDALERALPWPDAKRRASVSDVTRTLNFFEEMGAAYSQKQLDDRALIASFSVSIIQVMVKGWWWICWERAGLLARETEGGFSEEGYVEHQDMALALRKEHPSLAADPALRTNDTIRALCLPEGAGEPLHDPDEALAWEASRRLSRALSTFIATADEQIAEHGPVPRRLAAISGALGKLPAKKKGSKGRRPRGWGLFLIPKGIDQVCDEDWKLRRVEAKWLAEALERFKNYPSLEDAVALVEKMSTRKPVAVGSGGTRS
jgi:hypothetical protein